MSKKIYVGNMSYSSDESSLSDLFSQYGEVLSAKVIVDQFTGKSKGFAFIEMSNEDEAIAAINALNGKEVNGRQLKVNEAVDKPKNNNFRRNNNRY
ncbi:MAG: RNA-binding protein [Spirochaetes bacterium GWD1_27_9]|nr:MAG: RNA-binding protein [Spirochaetes bacterium GWB1_27_13]OHD27034.1 MAG: RNA-binding protein [Spirochaetes bacterium GWC1_27_15]OHD29445.1 MAG: RNA-binding protein [Spirochaetes bacterium GWD1_27_9]